MVDFVDGQVALTSMDALQGQTGRRRAYDSEGTHAPEDVLGDALHVSSTTLGGGSSSGTSATSRTVSTKGSVTLDETCLARRVKEVRRDDDLLVISVTIDPKVDTT